MNKEAVSTAQVHKGLSGCQAFLCALLSPQHLKYSHRDAALNPVSKTQFTSAARHLLLQTRIDFTGSKPRFTLTLIDPASAVRPDVRSENEFPPQVHIYRYLCIHSSGGAGCRWSAKMHVQPGLNSQGDKWQWQHPRRQTSQDLWPQAKPKHKEKSAIKDEYFNSKKLWPSWLYLDHGLVLLLQLLIHDAVLVHWQQRQGAPELAALALRGPAPEFGQQISGEPGKLRVHNAVGEPHIWSQHMQLQGPADEVSSSLFMCSIVLICVFSYNHNNNQGFGSCFKGVFSYSPFLTVLMDELNLINVASLETNLPFKTLFKWYKGHLLSVKVLNRQKKQVI